MWFSSMFGKKQDKRKINRANRRSFFETLAE